MKIVYTLLFCFVSVVSFSQEKNIDRNAQVAKLTTVETKIILLEEKIARIEDRIELYPESLNDPNISNELQRLKDELMMSKNIKKSVKAYLDDSEPKKLEKKTK